MENNCAGVLFVIMLRAVALVPCQEYIKIKFLPMFWHFFYQIRIFSVLFCSVLIFHLKILYCIYTVVLMSESY